MLTEATGNEDTDPKRPRRSPAERNTETQFRRLLGTIPAAAYMCDPQGLITYFNEHAVRLWGRTPKLNDPSDRFCGSFKLYSTEGTPVAHDDCWMALALRTQKEYAGHEIVIERHDGQRTSVLAHAKPIYDDGDRLMGAVNVLVDISDHKLVQEKLRSLNETLELRVTERTVEADLRASQLWELASELTIAEQKERKKLAASLHEDLAQSLALCALKLSMLEEQAPEERSDATLCEAKDCVMSAIQYTRNLMYDLRPPDLYEMGLSAGVRRLAETMKQRHGLEVAVRTEGAANLDDEHRGFLFQAVKELLTNVVKYAGTKQASVTIRKNAQLVHITVEDHGVGLDVPKLKWSPSNEGGFGLLHIRERAVFMRGRMVIDNPPGGGTRVQLIVPVQSPVRRRKG